MTIINIPDDFSEKDIKKFHKQYPGVAPTLFNILENRTFTYITPQEYLELHEGKLPEHHTMKTLIASAKHADCGGYKCMNCDLEVWHMVEELGMCFSCITGESDPSEDYELTMDPKKQPHYIKT
jgi:hypothetical protein